MAITFRVQPHDIRQGVQVVEILIDGKMVATIRPEGEKGIKFVSAQNHGSKSIPPVPDIRIRFGPQPYIIREGRTVKRPQNP